MSSELRKRLFNEKKSGWENVDDQNRNNIFSFSEEYMAFLNNSKTERESIRNAKTIAEEHGFRDISSFENLNVGDRVYYINRDKAMYLAIIGERPISEGINIIGSHVDSPRIDLKPNPLYEDTGLAFFKTHYYGGIKKYQWTSIPLELHGVIVKPNGEKVEINIGQDDSDPIFTITDLLPHLAREQMDKKIKEAIPAESLNLLVGSIPYNDENEKEKIKLNILNLLNQKYGITEVDFLSSEIEIVPSFKTKSLGFDYSMVAGYGQDDRVCAYTSLRAITELGTPTKTVVCMLTDKEEIGSMGNTGMESRAFDKFMLDILVLRGENQINSLDNALNRSKMLSADVDAGYDPIYSTVYEKNNSSYLGHGVCLNKYTGSGGKYNSSEASAEYVAEVRRIFEQNNISYSIAELGKVDAGGGGTIAYILANKGVDVIDCGIPVLSMHAPYEVTSKYDIYSLYKAYTAFYSN